MPIPSETRRNRDGLPVIDLAAARELFRTAESSGLGRPGTDGIFDRWLDNRSDIAFYRNADRPLQARAVDVDDEVPETLSNSRIGQARLEAICLNPSQPDYYSDPRPEPSCAHPDDEEPEEFEEFEQTDEDEDTEAHDCFSGMPGLCWHDEVRRRPYAKVDSHQGHEDCAEEGCVLQLVNAYRGVFRDPHWDLSGELPPDFDGRSLRGLTVLVEAARRKLATERLDTEGPWRLGGFSCESDLVDPDGEDEEPDASDDEPDWESDAIRYYAEIDDDDDVPVLQITGARWGELHIFYREPVSVPGDEPLDAGTVDGLRTVLRRATEQVGEAGYRMNGDWRLHWSRCYVLLAD
ncbi:hypothetical protein [Streptomyces sp. NPDC047869]|uniref:hypothetical protein n=1 Tax=Streptomyces sp. NPDC047869 TaxID=3154709 RepID=UPI0034554175